jgi:hypothetical protein
MTIRSLRFNLSGIRCNPARTAENSGRTAGRFAVLSFAKPAPAQDFRGAHDLDS